MARTASRLASQEFSLNSTQPQHILKSVHCSVAFQNLHLLSCRDLVLWATWKRGKKGSLLYLLFLPGTNSVLSENPYLCISKRSISESACLNTHTDLSIGKAAIGYTFDEVIIDKEINRISICSHCNLILFPDAG